jgi:hypothetical protein
MIDFDDIDAWGPKLTTILDPLLPETAGLKFATAALEYIEDARDLLFTMTDREAVIDAMLTWIRSEVIVGYHGTRLIDLEVESIRADGLIPLKAESRRVRLERALSSHPEWPKVKDQLGPAIQAHGLGGAAGSREGQVHLTLSRAGLKNGFPHYLMYGSEFDMHLAQKLLGPSGLELLASDGEPMVIQVSVPGSRALEAAHPIFSVDFMRTRGEIPNIINEILRAWSVRLAHPGFQSQSLKIDCGMRFQSTVPASWITSIDPLEK